MSTVYLNGEFLPMEEARISPMDRGFLFGDGIYEVVPSYSGKAVGLGPHLDRMQNGLDAIDLAYQIDHDEWRNVMTALTESHPLDNLGIYVQISRGADSKRNHAMPTDVAPTLFAFAFEIEPPPIADINSASRYEVSATRDMRWQRCHIKSTSLLGNVLHYQHGHARGHHETILFNDNDELTEAAACNVFIVKDGVIATPNLDNQKLPGITRYMLLDMLKQHSSRTVEERIVTRAEVDNADEVWLTSSSKEVVPVVRIEDKPVGQGNVGEVWLEAQELFVAHRFDY